MWTILACIGCYLLGLFVGVFACALCCAAAKGEHD